MKKGIGITISLIGIIILLGTIVYQSINETNAAYMIPIGLLVTFSGLFYLMKNAKSKRED